MKWPEFLSNYQLLPFIEAQNVYADFVSSAAAAVQLGRWEKAGKLHQLKRGLYVLAEPYRKTELNELALAAVLKWPSYISLEKALEFYGLIPEQVHRITSVTTKRTSRFQTPCGDFEYRHIQPSLFWGYRKVQFVKQGVLIASPEKALLDLIYLKPVKPRFEYFVELRLQNTEQIDLEVLDNFAKRSKKRKLLEAAKMLRTYIQASEQDEEVI